MSNDAEDWLLRYAEVPQWSDMDIRRAVSKYSAVTDQTEKLRSFLQHETGVTLEPEDDDHAYRGQPFVVFAHGPMAGHYELEIFERADVETELEALQAFAQFASDDRILDVVMSRFDEQGKGSLESCGITLAATHPS